MERPFYRHIWPSTQHMSEILGHGAKRGFQDRVPIEMIKVLRCDCADEGSDAGPKAEVEGSRQLHDWDRNR